MKATGFCVEWLFEKAGVWMWWRDLPEEVFLWFSILVSKANLYSPGLPDWCLPGGPFIWQHPF